MVSGRWAALVVTCLVLLAASGCDAAPNGESTDTNDPLSSIKASNQIDPAQRSACMSYQGGPGPNATLTATSSSTVNEVQAAMDERFGAVAVATAAPDLPEDAVVTLCQFTIPAGSGTPPVDRVVLALAGDVGWWADGTMA